MWPFKKKLVKCELEGPFIEKPPTHLAKAREIITALSKNTGLNHIKEYLSQDIYFVAPGISSKNKKSMFSEIKKNSLETIKHKPYEVIHVLQDDTTVFVLTWLNNKSRPVFNSFFFEFDTETQSVTRLIIQTSN